MGIWTMRERTKREEKRRRLASEVWVGLAVGVGMEADTGRGFLGGWFIGWGGKEKGERENKRKMISEGEGERKKKERKKKRKKERKYNLLEISKLFMSIVTCVSHGTKNGRCYKSCSLSHKTVTLVG